MDTREQQVSATLIELADTLVSEYDLLGYLDVLLHRSMAVMGAAAGGVMLRGKGAVLEPLASSDEAMRLLELFELQRLEGPCIDSYRTGEQIVEGDLIASSRWPQFTPAAVERGYASALAIPLRLRGEAIGALNLFGARPGGFEPADVAAAQAFADMATIGILHERAIRESRQLSEQLHSALNSRIVLEQAKGMLAERGDVDVDEAFKALRQYTRDHNLRLRAVASDLVSGALPIDAVMRHPSRRPGSQGA